MEKPGGITVVLMGRTGNGKSATGNSILGRPAFQSGLNYSSVTKESEMQQTTLKGGRILNVIDTPGLFDPEVPPDFIRKEIARCVGLGKDGVHAVLLVLSVTNRFTPEEAAVLDTLQTLFGPKIVDYMAVVFTGGDMLQENNMTLEEYLKDCPKTLKEVLHRCKNRKVVFNNESASKKEQQKQVNELMKQIDVIMLENQGQPYTNEFLSEAQEMSKKLLSEKEHVKSQRRFSKEKTCDAQQVNNPNTELLKHISDKLEETMRKKAKELEEQLASERIARQQAEQELESAQAQAQAQAQAELQLGLAETHEQADQRNMSYENPRGHVLVIMTKCIII